MARTVARQRVAYAALAVVMALSGLGCEGLLTREAPYGVVRVQAVSRAGNPLPGIGVQLYTGRRPMGYAATDIDGRAVFRLVPPGTYGLFLTAPASEYADLSELLGGPPRNLRDGIAVSVGFDSSFSFTFARRGPGALEARARDAGGAPLPGIRIEFYRPSGIFAARLSGADGVARLDSVQTGVYGAIIAPPDSLGVRGAPIQYRDGLVVDRDIVPRAEFTLATCLGTVAVQVRDQSNAPISGIEVLRYSPTASERRATTDGAGTVRFTRTECGEYGVALQPLAGYTVSFVRDSGYVDGLVVTSGGTVSATLRATRN